MGHIKVKIPHGINSVEIGNVTVTSVNLRVKDSFPVKRLPKEIIRSKATGKNLKEYYQLAYTGVDSKVNRRVIKRLGVLLREHAQKQLDEKYAWVDIFNQETSKKQQYEI
jgi:hypothetical protein